ncbi:hypothetical protein Acr_11g0008080 [Actinidia rufa]|uniref:Uncharacterized protein n=1 Tax=Actinidia rufa TaxID=165716 RepID=A0A7J0FCU0_9ERIC|nr:hypothetical protein Acr_11g0008080 [Actinidia rufa]
MNGLARGMLLLLAMYNHWLANGGGQEAHPKKAKEIYGKTFPYYEDLAILFGKDRATGAGAEDPTQMEQVYIPNPLQDSFVDDVDDFYVPLFDDQFMNSPRELTAHRATILGELEKVDLTLIQQFKLALIIGNKEERVDQFLNTRDERKQAWAEVVLNSHVYDPIP